MLYAIAAIVAGLALLVWSADRFVGGAAHVARHFGMSPLLIGMLIIGFGTSAPEMLVSAQAALQGNPSIALGNAYGSNITNIALILGLTALISPIAVKSTILRKELPLLTVITLFALAQLWDGELSRLDGAVLLALFVVLVGWSIVQERRAPADALAADMENDPLSQPEPLRSSVIKLVIGLLLLLASSRLLVWGAVEVAHTLGVSDLIIGLTIVAVGTSLPELASSVMAARKGEHDLALGNILGSNLFNTLAVVGIASTLHPLPVSAEVLYRDGLVMLAVTVSLFLFGYGFRGQGRINRTEGVVLMLAYGAYLLLLLRSV